MFLTAAGDAHASLAVAVRRSANIFSTMIGSSLVSLRLPDLHNA